MGGGKGRREKGKAMVHPKVELTSGGQTVNTHIDTREHTYTHTHTQRVSAVHLKAHFSGQPDSLAVNGEESQRPTTL